MNKVIKISALLASMALSACSLYSSHENGSTLSGVTQGKNGEKIVPINATQPSGSVGGHIGLNMNETDKMKMYRALDSAPGKATHWISESNGTDYTVTPVKKVVINGNPFCREYTVVAMKGSQQQQGGGTACISSDGNWQSVSGN